MQVMRCMFAIAQTLTYPLELFVVRHAVHALFFADQKRFTDQQHYMVTLILWSSSLAIALNVTDLGVVLELTGGVSAVFIGFVLPPLLHYKMGEFTPLIWRNPPGRRMAACKELAPSIYVMTFGVLAMILTVWTIGAEMLLGEGPHDAYSGGDNGIGTNSSTTTIGHRRLWLPALRP
jgi:amino acid permease